MGFLERPDGQIQLEVISNSMSIDYVVHHWDGRLYTPQMLFNYPFEEVNQI